MVVFSWSFSSQGFSPLRLVQLHKSFCNILYTSTYAICISTIPPGSPSCHHFEMLFFFQFPPPFWRVKAQISSSKKKHHLVGGFNPFEKYARQIGNHLPQFSRWKLETYLSCHHLVVFQPSIFQGVLAGVPGISTGSWTGCVLGTNPLQLEGKVSFGVRSCEVAIIWPAWIIALRNQCNSADVFC